MVKALASIPINLKFSWCFNPYFDSVRNMSPLPQPTSTIVISVSLGIVAIKFCTPRKVNWFPPKSWFILAILSNASRKISPSIEKSSIISWAEDLSFVCINILIFQNYWFAMCSFNDFG